MGRDTARPFAMWGWTEATDADLEILQRQLGRRPRGVVAVAARDRCGEPQVIVNRPILMDEAGRRTVFPTLFWLTSPYLVREVSVLEASGWIGRLRERLLEEPEWAEALRAAHAATARLRLELCSPGELEALRAESPRQYQALVETGVAGMRGDTGVKCLHAHLADYLARRKAEPGAVNPIGREVARLLLQRGVDLLGDCVPRTGRVAAIDAGSNSVRLWVGEWREEDGGARLKPVHRELVTTRLGAGLGPGQALDPGAAAATLEAVDRLARRAAQLGAAPPVGAATAAARDAADGGAFLLRVWEETGQSLPQLSGDQEAELAYLGVLTGFEAGPAGPLWVIDVGGRSTEMVLGDAEGRILWRRSFPLGAVRLTDEHIQSDPVSQEELAAVRRAARAGLDVAEIEAVKRELATAGGGSASARVAAVGGTATTAAAIGLEMRVYDPGRVHGSRWSREQVTELVHRLAALSLEERRKVAGLPPQRADIIVAGLCILEQCLEVLGAATFSVSEADLLQGLIASRLGGRRKGRRPPPGAD